MAQPLKLVANDSTNKVIGLLTVFSTECLPRRDDQQLATVGQQAQKLFFHSADPMLMTVCSAGASSTSNTAADAVCWSCTVPGFYSSCQLRL
jgi:hypothetical protein